jgi:cysteine desulfurase
MQEAMKNVYLDYAATTPLDPHVLEAMLPYLQDTFANPSSLHRYGREARKAVETARERVAAAIHAHPREIVFTSGATEADNHAIRSAMQRHPGGHIITSLLEHSAVLTTCRHLETLGHPVTYLTPDARGMITPEMVQAALRNDTVLVALMLVNNETGVITDIPRISGLLHGTGVLLFCDAVQAFGIMPIDVRALGVDMLSLSAHKAYGPKGVGVLWVRAGLELPSFMLGGEQERGLRAGTLNTPAIVGMGKAAELVAERLQEDIAQITEARDYLQDRLLAVDGVALNAAGAPRAPKHVNVSVAGVDGETLLMNLDALGVYASAGSACAAGTLEPSHVLLAMGLSRDQARASIRFSLGRGVTRDMLDYAVTQFEQALARSRLAD